MFVVFENSLNEALVLTEDLEARIKQLIGQINKLDKKGSIGLRRFKHQNNLENPEDVARNIAQWDPSGTEKVPKGLYVGWILKMISSGQIRLPEDGVRVRNSLTIFDKIKKTTRFKGDKDIHKYKHFRDLESVTKKFQSELSQTDEPNNLRAWFKWVERQGVDKFYGDEKFTVLKFDSSAYQENREITGGIEVVPKKMVIGQHGQDIETSWVPLWADPNANPENAQTVTPTAMALSRLACGTSYCVASPITAQTYLNAGPLYATFKEGDLYLLANVTWSEFMNQEDLGFKHMAATTAYFMSKLIIDTHEKLGEQAVRNITRIIKTSLEAGMIRGGGGGDLPPRIKDTIAKAIQLGSRQK